MLKESFFMGALIGAAVGILVYKNNSDAKMAFDKGEKIVKEKIEECQKDLAKVVDKNSNKNKK